MTTTTTAWRTLRHTTDLPPQPWINGGGSTTELISADESALFYRRDFPVDGRWRLSLASLTATGPYSPMPGIDRIHTPVEGIGLTVDGEPVPVTALTSYAFPGEAEVTLSALPRRTRALNLMVDRDSPAAGRLEVRVVDAAVPVDNALAAVLLDGTFDVLVPWREGMGEVRRTDNGGRLLAVTWIP